LRNDDLEADRGATNTYRARVSMWHTADAVRRYSTWDSETVGGPTGGTWNLKAVEAPAGRDPHKEQAVKTWKDDFKGVTRADLLAAAETGVCPACSAGPLRSLANHIFMEHKVTTGELKEYFGINRQQRFQDEDLRRQHSQTLSAELKAHPEHFAKLQQARDECVRAGRNKLPERTQTVEARRTNKALIAACRKNIAAAQAAITPEVRSKAMRTRWANITPEARAEFSRKVSEGRGRTLRSCIVCGVEFWPGPNGYGRRTCGSPGCRHEARVRSGRIAAVARAARRKA
jgi:hypothetical protein